MTTFKDTDIREALRRKYTNSAAQIHQYADIACRLQREKNENLARYF